MCRERCRPAGQVGHADDRRSFATRQADERQHVAVHIAGVDPAETIAGEVLLPQCRQLSKLPFLKNNRTSAVLTVYNSAFRSINFRS